MGGITDGGISSDEKREKEMQNGRKQGILVKEIKEGKETNKRSKRKDREGRNKGRKGEMGEEGRI